MSTPPKAQKSLIRAKAVLLIGAFLCFRPFFARKDVEMFQERNAVVNLLEYLFHNHLVMCRSTYRFLIFEDSNVVPIVCKPHRVYSLLGILRICRIFYIG